MATALSPAAVFGLGDLQYNAGELAEFVAADGPTWGALTPITAPVPGNHEYGTPGAGYFDYFGALAGDPALGGYYSFDLGR